MLIPGDLRYSTDHEWVRIDGNRVTVGITDYAQDALGDVVFVQLPEQGVSVAAGESMSEVESTKSVSDIFAPVAGRVVAVNEEVESKPELLNADPYGAGWLFVLEVDPSSVEALLDAAAYQALTEQ